MHLSNFLWQNQFVFLHDTILEHALCGKTLVPTGPELRAFMNQLDEGGDQTGKNGYEKHFQVIRIFCSIYTLEYFPSYQMECIV